MDRGKQRDRTGPGRDWRNTAGLHRERDRIHSPQNAGPKTRENSEAGRGPPGLTKRGRISQHAGGGIRETLEWEEVAAGEHAK